MALQHFQQLILLRLNQTERLELGELFLIYLQQLTNMELLLHMAISL